MVLYPSPIDYCPKHAQVCWFSDDENVVKILDVGSKKNLQAVVLEVFALSVCFQVNLEPE